MKNRVLKLDQSSRLNKSEACEAKLRKLRIEAIENTEERGQRRSLYIWQGFFFLNDSFIFSFNFFNKN